MFQIIDYRNGRYQGELLNQQPHGIGIFMDRDFLFCIAEWREGQVEGSAIIIYPSGRVFCGSIRDWREEGLCSYELVQDHVQLVRWTGSQSRDMMAGVLPLHRNIVAIDNTDPRQASVTEEYKYSVVSEAENHRTIAQILGLQGEVAEQVYSHRNCVQFFIDRFANPYPNHFEYFVRELKGKKEYFIGLRQEGLGVKIEPIEELAGFVKKKTGRVYLFRAMGSFSADNQITHLGYRILDNSMKGHVFEEGVFGRPDTLISYETDNRPVNSVLLFVNEMKNSLHYRDDIIDTGYIYDQQDLIRSFDVGLKTVKTEAIAQNLLENPNNDQEVLREIEEKRKEKERKIEKAQLQASRMTGDNSTSMIAASAFALGNNDAQRLQKVKDDIYRSVSRKKGGTPSKVDMSQYKEAKYVDPRYTELRDTRANQDRSLDKKYETPDRNTTADYSRRIYDSLEEEEPRRYRQYESSRRRNNGSISPAPKSKYNYLDGEGEEVRQTGRNDRYSFSGREEEYETREVPPPKPQYGEHIPYKPDEPLEYSSRSIGRGNPSPYQYGSRSPARVNPTTSYRQTATRNEPRGNGYQFYFDEGGERPPQERSSRSRGRPSGSSRRQDYSQPNNNFDDPIKPISPGFSPTRYNKKGILGRNPID